MPEPWTASFRNSTTASPPARESNPGGMLTILISGLTSLAISLTSRCSSAVHWLEHIYSHHSQPYPSRYYSKHSPITQVFVQESSAQCSNPLLLRETVNAFLSLAYKSTYSRSWLHVRSQSLVLGPRRRWLRASRLWQGSC